MSSIPKEDMLPRAPDFYCIGVQKAATTWLAENMSRHSSYSPPLLKEAHYFDALYHWANVHGRDEMTLTWPIYKRIAETLYWAFLERDNGGVSDEVEFVERMRRLSKLYNNPLTDDWYRSVFTRPESQISGDFTPQYILLDRAAFDHMETVSPGAKYIICLRDPIERAWSQIRMDTSRYMDSEFVLQLLSTNPYIVLQSQYERLVPDWIQRVNSERLHICHHKALEDGPEAFLRSVFRFLGLSEDVEYSGAGDRVFGGAEVSVPPEIKSVLLKSFGDTYNYLADEFPGIYQAPVV